MGSWGTALGVDLCPPWIESLPTQETNTSLVLVPDGNGGVEWGAGGGGGGTWIGLTDTPAAYAGSANQLTGPNPGETAIEFKPLTELASGSTLALDTSLTSVHIGSGDPGNYGTATGNGVVTVGHGAGASLTSGDFVVAVGAGAASSIDDGDQATCFGHETGQELFNAATFGGFRSGQYANSAGEGEAQSGNTGWGRYSLQGAMSGVFNIQECTAIGDEALRNVNSTQGSTAVGYRSGLNTTGGNNSYFGRGAGSLTTSGTGQIMIGVNAEASSATATDELNIGDLIFGDLSLGGIRIGGSGAPPSTTFEIRSLDLDMSDNEIYNVSLLTVKDANTATIKLLEDDAPSDEGDVRLKLGGGDFSIETYSDAGAFVEKPIRIQSTAGVVSAITLTATDIKVAGDLDMNANDIVGVGDIMGDSGASLNIQPGSGRALQLNGEDGTTYFRITSGNVPRFSADLDMNANAIDGIGTMGTFSAGTGAPSGGSNGDMYWRTDGGIGTMLYGRISGTWQALA